MDKPVSRFRIDELDEHENRATDYRMVSFPKWISTFQAPSIINRHCAMNNLIYGWLLILKWFSSHCFRNLEAIFASSTPELLIRYHTPVLSINVYKNIWILYHVRCVICCNCFFLSASKFYHSCCRYGISIQSSTSARKSAIYLAWRKRTLWHLHLKSL